jgi:hypothetical protein
VTAERYPAVFTGLLSLKGRGGYTCLRVDGDPLGSGNYTVSRGPLPYRKLGQEISFADPPEDCKGLMLDTYLKMWGP